MKQLLFFYMFAFLITQTTLYAAEQSIQPQSILRQRGTTRSGRRVAFQSCAILPEKPSEQPFTHKNQMDVAKKRQHLKETHSVPLHVQQANMQELEMSADDFLTENSEDFSAHTEESREQKLSTASAFYQYDEPQEQSLLRALGDKSGIPASQHSLLNGLIPACDPHFFYDPIIVLNDKGEEETQFVLNEKRMNIFFDKHVESLAKLIELTKNRTFLSNGRLKVYLQEIVLLETFSGSVEKYLETHDYNVQKLLP